MRRYREKRHNGYEYIYERTFAACAHHHNIHITSSASANECLVREKKEHLARDKKELFPPRIYLGAIEHVMVTIANRFGGQ